MGYTIPTKEPKTCQAGTSLFFDIAYPDYPASDGWTLRYYLRAKHGTDYLDFSADEITADGTGWEVRVPSTRTATLTPGPYSLIARISKDGAIHPVYSGDIAVTADATADAAPSENRAWLTALYAARTASAGNAAYVTVSALSRSVTYRNSGGEGSLDAEIAKYEYLVALESSANPYIAHAVTFVG